MAGVAPGIITNGLGGSAHNMIAGFFHLGPLEVIIPGSPPIPPEPEIPDLPRGPGGTGGAIGRPYEDRTDPWDKDQPRAIIIRIKFKDETIERIYHVSAKRRLLFFFFDITEFPFTKSLLEPRTILRLPSGTACALDLKGELCLHSLSANLFAAPSSLA